MPFVGRDWRANGEQWTKTEIGSWERRPRLSSSSISSSHLPSSLSDVFDSLDLINSVENTRRLNYLIKVVKILFKEKLGELSGNAQRSLFQVLERMIDTAVKTGENLSLMQRLLGQFLNSIHLAYPFYYYIGSAALWQGHVEMLNGMQERIQQAQLKISHRTEEVKPCTFDRLPREMQFEILRRLDNGADLVHLGMINSNLYRMSQELLLWRQLCLYHFGGEMREDNEKIRRLIKRQENETIDWKKIYFKLKRRYGLREVYAEMLYQCQACKSLFWQESTHPCPYATRSSAKSITPRKFVALLI